MNSKFKIGTILPPEKPNNIPVDAQWLAGQGAGAWFSLKYKEGKWIGKRFQPSGELDCEGVFEGNIDENIPFEITYLSHCSQITILQNNKRIVLTRKMDV